MEKIHILYYRKMHNAFPPNSLPLSFLPSFSAFFMQFYFIFIIPFLFSKLNYVTIFIV